MIIAEYDLRIRRWTVSVHKGARVPLAFNGLNMSQIDVGTAKQRRQLNNMAEVSGRGDYYEYIFRKAKQSYTAQVRKCVQKYFLPHSPQIVDIMNERGWKYTLLLYHILSAWNQSNIETEPLGFWLLQSAIWGSENKIKAAKLAVTRFLYKWGKSNLTL